MHQPIKTWFQMFNLSLMCICQTFPLPITVKQKKGRLTDMQFILLQQKKKYYYKPWPRHYGFHSNFTTIQSTSSTHLMSINCTFKLKPQQWQASKLSSQYQYLINHTDHDGNVPGNTKDKMSWWLIKFSNYYFFTLRSDVSLHY